MPAFEEIQRIVNHMLSFLVSKNQKERKGEEKDEEAEVGKRTKKKIWYF